MSKSSTYIVEPTTATSPSEDLSKRRAKARQDTGPSVVETESGSDSSGKDWCVVSSPRDKQTPAPEPEPPSKSTLPVVTSDRAEKLDDLDSDEDNSENGDEEIDEDWGNWD